MSKQQNPKKRTSFSKTIDQGAILLMSAIGILIVILAFLILFHQNANATKGYILRTLERDRTELLREQELINMKLAAEQALDTISESSVAKKMINPREVQYR